MATRTQDYEGVAAGAAPAAGNTVSNGSTAISTTLTAGTGASSIVGTTTTGEVIDGTTSAKLTATGTAQAINSQNTGGATQAGLSTRRRWTAAPTANINEQVIRNTGGRSLSISLLTNGKVKISTNTADLYTTPAALTFPGVYRITGCVDTGTSANNDGKVQFAIYDSTETLAGGMTAPVEFTGLANVGAGAATSTTQWGKTDTGALTSTWTEIMDTVVSTDTYALPGAPAVNTPPTVTGPGTVNVTGTTASLTFNAADTGGGTITSFTCVNQSNTANTTVTPTIGSPVVTGAGTASASATFPITGLSANAKYFFGCIATDNSNAASTTSVATVNQTKVTPDIRSVTLTGFTVVGGGTALDCIQAGAPTTRYLESTAPPGGASVTVTFQPVTASSVPKLFTIPVRAKDTTTTETATVTLKMNDTTTIATRGPFTLTTTDAACGGTTTTSETAAITDYSKLSIVVVTN